MSAGAAEVAELLDASAARRRAERIRLLSSSVAENVGKPLVLAAEAERWLASLPNVSGKAS